MPANPVMSVRHFQNGRFLPNPFK